MENACRIIIEQILDNEITSKKELEKAKHKVCRDFKLDQFMSNSLILKYASPQEKEFVTTAGGGAVEITMTGKKVITKVKLSEEVVDPDDIEMLEDLIMAAANEALRKVDDENAAMMSKLTGGMGGLGGLF